MAVPLTRGMEIWLSSYFQQTSKRRKQVKYINNKSHHVFLCIADHFEPQRDNADAVTAQRRLNHWLEDYPRLFEGFRDSDGRPPRHSFFYPIDQYDPREVEELTTKLCARGFGEVEIHLHHDNDTSDHLRNQLLQFKQEFSSRFGQLAKDKAGNIAYAFIHGNWALDNARPDGRWCGVNNEIDILRETGCYADLTMPSAPCVTQTRKINSLYYAVDDPDRPKSHNQGIDVGHAPKPDRGLMMIQGPLTLDWSRRKFGVIPKVENACLQNNQAPSMRRLQEWLRASITVPARPDWLFVKLHTHGAHEPNIPVLLGEPMVRFHQALADRAKADSRFHYHYVTAREMYNLIKAAEAGWESSPREALDFELRWNGS